MRNERFKTHKKEEKLATWERCVRFYKAKGYYVVKEGKYITLATTTETDKIFIGKNGAVRKGKNQTESMSLTSFIMPYVTLWEKKEGLR